MYGCYLSTTTVLITDATAFFSAARRVITPRLKKATSRDVTVCRDDVLAEYMRVCVVTPYILDADLQYAFRSVTRGLFLVFVREAKKINKKNCSLNLLRCFDRLCSKGCTGVPSPAFSAIPFATLQLLLLYFYCSKHYLTYHKIGGLKRDKTLRIGRFNLTPVPHPTDVNKLTLVDLIHSNRRR